ncbi:type II toxin-antitoxin system Phd/YefM family antitoxin [Lonepinella sp. BR2919]|uniref:type II toxin-antitoxin system Phd/YefM family antitoxin n=1 Tax=unclassified Lonepinella TaxID=2642006 RepID=UPI003F6DD42F
MTIHQIYTGTTASITDLKRDPMGTINAGTAINGTMAILNRNQPAFYCVTPELFKYLQNAIEDFELGKTALERKADGKFIAVNLDDL